MIDTRYLEKIQTSINYILSQMPEVKRVELANWTSPTNGFGIHCFGEAEDDYLGNFSISLEDE